MYEACFDSEQLQLMKLHCRCFLFAVKHYLYNVLTMADSFLSISRRLWYSGQLVLQANVSITVMEVCVSDSQ